MANDLVKKGYNAIATTYTASRDQFASKKYLDAFVTHLPKGSSVLDIGCGSGVPVDRYLVEKGFAVSGVDISEKQIELARKHVPEGFFEVKDVTALEDYGYCVEAIVSFYAIFHIPREQHAELFRKFATFMPKGGIVLVTMGANGEDAGSVQEFQGEKMFYSFYSAQKNREIIEQAGFRIILNEIDTSGGEKHQIILATL